jgi:hypothetical protein
VRQYKVTAQDQKEADTGCAKTDPVRQREIRNVRAEMIDHDREDRERAQSVKLRLITLQRAIAHQGLLRGESTRPTPSDTSPSPRHDYVTNPAAIRYQLFLRVNST